MSFESDLKRTSIKASKPNNPKLWARAIAQAKRKFDVYPSAYANMWASRWYKTNGGTWSAAKETTVKHLPGRHNQSAHGRKGPAGMASRGAYTAARAEGATHREALDKGKLASQQVREQMRAERRAEVAKRRTPTPKPDAVKRPQDMTDDEFIRHLDDEKSYAPKARQAVVAAREHIKQKLAGDDSDFDSKQLKELASALKLDPKDADTPAIIAGMFGIQFSPGATSTELLINVFSSGKIQLVTTNIFDTGEIGGKTMSTIIRKATIDNNGNVTIKNDYAKNNTPVKGMGYANLRQQAYAAMLYNKKTNNNVNANTVATSSINNKGYREFDGAHIWPLMGYDFDLEQSPLLIKSVRNNGFNGITQSVELMTATNASGQTGASLWGKIADESRDRDGYVELNGTIDYTNRTNNPGLDVLVEYGDSRYRTRTKAFTMTDNELDLTQSDLDLLVSLWGKKASTVTVKHLPGRHNQASHGRRGGASGGSASAFTTWNDRELAKMNKDLQDIVNADPVTYTEEQRRAIDDYVSTNIQSARPGVVLKNLQRDGIPFDEGMRLIKEKSQSIKSLAEQQLPLDMRQLYLEKRIQLHQGEQNVRFSRMDRAEQDKIFAKLKERINANDPTLTHDDYEMLVTTGLYGHPQMRVDSFRLLDSSVMAKQKRLVENKDGLQIRVDGSMPKFATPLDIYKYYSLDYRMLANTPSAQKTSDLSQMRTSGATFNQDVDSFMRAFLTTHVTESTDNVLGAAIQHHMSYIGPNFDAQEVPSFYPRGVKTPEANPVIVAYLKSQYRETQSELIQRGITSTELYRGTASNFRLGIPMSPWSDERDVSVGFGDVLNEAKIPRKYIFAHHSQDRFDPTYYEENEWLVLESGMIGNAKRRRTAGTPMPRGGTKPTFELTVKAMRDIPFAGSLLEPQYDIFYNYRITSLRGKAMQRQRTKAVTTKHLPGKHNQSSHGRGGSGGGGGGMSASAFNEWNENATAKLNQELNSQANAKAIEYTDEQRVLLEELARKNFDHVSYTLTPEIMVAQCYGYGIPFETAKRYLEVKNPSSVYNPISAALGMKVADHHREQSVRFSNMTKEEQDAVFSKLKDRVTAKDPTLTTDDMEMLVTAGLYGHPQMRMDAYYALRDAQPLSNESRIVVNKEYGTKLNPTGFDGVSKSPLESYQYYSLDYRMAKTIPETSPLYKQPLSEYPTSEEWFSRNYKRFTREFLTTHVTENTENVLGAAIQSHMSHVGPNADAPRPPSFYPEGVRTPEPNPVLIGYLNAQYRQTQAELSASGTTSTQLFRGTASDFRLGIPMSPWSDKEMVATEIGAIVNRGNIGNKYIFAHHQQEIFNKTFENEREWLILETAGMLGTTVVNTNTTTALLSKPIYELTMKAMRDIPFAGSLLEPQYDIFYNYHITSPRDKAVQRQRTKAVTTKHLPGKHNQSTHGRKGPAGMASRGAYTAARAEGATHREALDKGKLASQQVREQMRAERRAQVAERRKANPYGLKFDAPTADAPNPISLESLSTDSPLIKEGVKALWKNRSTSIMLADEAKEVEDKSGKTYDGEKGTFEHSLWVVKTAKEAGIPLSAEMTEIDVNNFRLKLAKSKEFQAIVYKALGYNGKPRLVDSNELPNVGNTLTDRNGNPLIVYRGVKEVYGGSIFDTSKDIPAQAVFDDFTSGATHYVGTGISGNGTYFAFDNGTIPNFGFLQAASYGSDRANGVTFAGAISANSRIATPEQYIAQRSYTHTNNQSDKFASEFWSELDEGSKMALLGWDGYTPDNWRFVVLNRGATIIGKTVVTEPIK